MKEPLCSLTKSVSITFIYGKESKLSSTSCGEDVSKARQNVFVNLVEKAEHHVHAEDSEVFNSIVQGLLADVDRNRDKCKKKVEKNSSGST